MNSKFKYIFFLIFVLGTFILLSFSTNKQKINEADLGKELFHDKILSSDYSISCASCHIPEYGFADTVALSRGVNGKLTLRNAPSVMNVLNRSVFFHDGRAKTLEEQAKGPIENPGEMNLPIAEAVERLNSSDKYKTLFHQVYNQNPDETTLLKAISAFEKTLETESSFFDEEMMKEKPQLPADIEEGRNIFTGKGNCFDCHNGVDFTNDEFRNIGIFNGKNLNDSGRYVVSKKTEDMGKFKVPGLRNVAVTAPYMHNGMFKTLEEVIEYYNEPDRIIADSQNRDSLVKKLNLSEQEKKSLVAFLKSLTDKRFVKK